MESGSSAASMGASPHFVIVASSEVCGDIVRVTSLVSSATKGTP